MSATTTGSLTPLVIGTVATIEVSGQSYTWTTDSSGACGVTVPGGVLTVGSQTVTSSTAAVANNAAGSGSIV